MAKKRKGNKKKDKTDSELMDSAHKIWLAGLGGLAAAEEEGSKLFKSLVSRGRVLEDRFKSSAGVVGSRIRGTVKKARSEAGSTIDDIESALDSQVSSTLHRLGVPTRDEVARLTRRVEALTRAIENGGKKTTKRKKKAAKKKTAKRKTRTKKKAS